MSLRRWMCVLVFAAWTMSATACVDALPSDDVTHVTQALSPAGPVDAIQLCGSLLGGECPSDTYCRQHDGVCGEVTLGWCAPMNQFCPMNYDPVCACDGETYSNECTMMAAGVSLHHMGACVEGCTSHDECGPSGWCDIPECGPEAAPGKCVKAPKACNRMWAPVCGCDGETYSNDCRRLKAGVGLKHEGPCAEPCGGFAGLTCGAKEICYYPEGTCDWADHMGQCESPPKVCPKNIDPVCGCDGETYRNLCMMKREGVSMDHEGLCCEPMLCLVGEAIDTDGDGCADLCPPAQSCEEENPAGCKNTGCEEGEVCAYGLDCTPSICFCDGESGAWVCTKDCGGGICIPDEGPLDPCADFVSPGCVQSGCDDGFECDTSVGCVPSACGCDPETGAIMCTADCGGGTCVPEESDGPLCEAPNPQACTPGTCPEGSTCDLSQGCSASHCECVELDGEGHWNCTKDCVPGLCIPDEPIDLCADFASPGCVQSGCDEGFECDTSVGCVPSACSCDPATGAIMCTADCGGGTCVPEESDGPLCEAPNPQACTPGTCPEGSTCDLSQGCSASHCECVELDGEGHWNCTKDCVPGLCIPDGPLAEGCCATKGDCADSEICVNPGSTLGGVCKPTPPPAFPGISCWSDAGCPGDSTCEGGVVCPCGAQCFVPDSPGMCSQDEDEAFPELPEE